MHPVLHNAELLSEICQYFTEPCELPVEESKILYHIDYKTCMAVALTCKRFTSPALDIIWQELVLHDIRPLITLIHGVEEVTPPGFLTKSTPICSTDLELLRAYGRRVRYLTVCGDKNGGIFAHTDPTILVQLSQILGSQPMLPSLRVVHILPGIDQSEIDFFVASPFLSLLISPSLRTVHIHDSDHLHSIDSSVQSPALWLFFHNLASSKVHRSLRKITLAFPFPPHTLFTISRLSNLESLSLGAAVTCATIMPLASLQNLRFLLMCLEEATVNLVQPEMGIEFPALVDLEISTDITSAFQLFTSYKFPTLFSLNIGVRGKMRNMPYLPIAPLNSLIVERLPMLQRLRISDIFTMFPEPWSSFSSLAPLHLTSLHLGDVKIASLSRDDFDQIISNWPLLTSLALPVEFVECLDHTALIVIAAKLPKLKDLRISLRLAGAAPSVLADMEYEQHFVLNDLVIGRSAHPIHHMGQDFDALQVNDMARFIARLFPNVNAECDDTYGYIWSNLRFLPDFVRNAQEDFEMMYFPVKTED